jgi:hypothetical protein
VTQHHWKDIRGLGEREDELAGTGGEKPRKLGHLTYRDGKPVEGLCYCALTRAHDEKALDPEDAELCTRTCYSENARLRA